MAIKKSLTISFILITSIILLGCSSKSDDENPVLEPITFEGFKKEFNSNAFNTGINDIVLFNGDVLGNRTYLGLDWRFRIIMPDVDFTNNKRPLIINLHDASSSDDTHTTTWCLAEPGFGGLDPIILSPYGGFISWTHTENQVRLLALIEVVSLYLPVDTDKIVVMGTDAGGVGSWFYAETRPDIFSAAVPINSTYNLISAETGNARYIGTPTYAIYGEDDTLNPLSSIEDWVNESTTIAGSDITLELVPKLNHLANCKFEAILRTKVSDWLINHVWN